MTTIYAQRVSALLTDDGTADGFVEVGSTHNIRVGAKGNVSSTTVNRAVVVESVTDNLVGLRNASVPSGVGRSAMDDLLTAEGARFSQEEGVVNEPAIIPEAGVTASRPGAPSLGEVYFDTDLGLPVWWDGNNWVGVPTSGDTASRPVAPAVGYAYFDTDIGQPIWWDGADWVGMLEPGATSSFYQPSLLLTAANPAFVFPITVETGHTYLMDLDLWLYVDPQGEPTTNVTIVAELADGGVTDQTKTSGALVSICPEDHTEDYYFEMVSDGTIDDSVTYSDDGFNNQISGRLNLTFSAGGTWRLIILKDADASNVYYAGGGLTVTDIGASAVSIIEPEPDPT